jgi:crotonobetainyl-CoA:carnitine CoA-transferase CaiB-like acyl-CoA transferase
VIQELAGDERFADAESRAKHATELAALLEQRFASETAQTWFSRLDDAGVPVEIADPRTPTSWFDDPELVANGLVADYRHPEYGRFRQFGHLVHLSETPGRIGGPPPRLGEDSVEVLTSLGYSAEQIQELRDKAVTTWPDHA